MRTVVSSVSARYRTLRICFEAHTDGGIRTLSNCVKGGRFLGAHDNLLRLKSPQRFWWIMKLPKLDRFSNGMTATRDHT